MQWAKLAAQVVQAFEVEATLPIARLSDSPWAYIERRACFGGSSPVP